MPFHLYLHMPFCRRKCPYCDFYKKVPLTDESQRFIKALAGEISAVEKTQKWAENDALTVYFGGGTPSLHSPEDFAAILRKIGQVWTLSPSAEITIEANPDNLSMDWLRGGRDIGINRLSLGVQSFSKRKLAMLYRSHHPEENRKAVELARLAGFSNLSLDLIFGLPDETLEEWEADLMAALALNVDHVSLYNLEFHPGTPFYRWKEAGRLRPLPEDREADMYLLAHDVLTSASYGHYEISNFAKPGFFSRHNLAYWESKPYLGLGPSAHSFDGISRRFWNVSDLKLYFDAITENRLPIEKELILNDRERREEWTTLSLRRFEGIAFDEACARLGDSATRKLWQRAEQLPVSLRSLSGERFALTPAGWFRENSVLLWLFEN